MSDVQPPRSNRAKQTKTTHIEENSATFKWMIPAAIVVLSIFLIVLIAVSIAVVINFSPLR